LKKNYKKWKGQKIEMADFKKNWEKCIVGSQIGEEIERVTARFGCALSGNAKNLFDLRGKKIDKKTKNWGCPISQNLRKIICENVCSQKKSDDDLVFNTK